MLQIRASGFRLDEEVPAKYASKFAIPTYVVYFHTFNLIFSLMNDLVLFVCLFVCLEYGAKKATSYLLAADGSAA